MAPSFKLELARFLGGTHRTERLTHIWLPQKDTEGGDAQDGKTNTNLAIRERHRGGGNAQDRKTNTNLAIRERHSGGGGPTARKD